MDIRSFATKHALFALLTVFLETPVIAEPFGNILPTLSSESPLSRRMAAADRMMATIRDTLPRIRKAETRLGRRPIPRTVGFLLLSQLTGDLLVRTGLDVFFFDKEGFVAVS